jgi:hypothetical protein
MPHSNDKLWPYNKGLAFATIPLVWLFFTIIFMLGQRYAGWQNTLEGAVILVVASISFLPVLLLLLDFFSGRGAVLDIKGVKIDFSKINLDTQAVKRESFGLPDNIGVDGALITDSTAMNIVKALAKTFNQEVAVLNLKSGDAWWVTRLLAFSAGAARTGSPAILVFIGKKENVSNAFLGMAKPKDIVNAIVEGNDQYKLRYDKAIRITQQVLFFSDDSLLPPNFILAPDISRYTSLPEYVNLREAVTEQIILDQMANVGAYTPVGSLEEPPDKITISRLCELLAHCLYKDEIELSASHEQQIDKLLSSKAPYIALVKDGQYDSALKQSDGERLVLTELFRQSKNDKVQTT